MKLGVVILAAGQGSRMRSNLPKVLHKLAGKPLLTHVVDTADAIHSEHTTIVYGHGGEQVKSALSDRPLEWCEQLQQLGTGHAVMQAMPGLANVDKVMVLYGDVPLISESTLTQLLTAAKETELALLTVKLDNPMGYGRIVRNADNQVCKIVEQKDASSAELTINEVNTGILAVDRSCLKRWLDRTDNSNAQEEYYLTDIIELAVDDGVNVATVNPSSEEEVMGVNDRLQLAQLERHFQRQQAEDIMRAGATLADPNRFDCRGSLTTGKDVTIDVNVVIEGDVVLGDGVTVGSNCLLKNCTIAAHSEILSNCIIEESQVGEASVIGPFARLRPETRLAEKSKIGNFVEIKKSVIGIGSKVNHLSYIGDSTIGANVNIGAGTITCNYDGANKHQTIIGDDVFVGSDSQLVAPVEIGAGTTIGAGSTITKSTSAGKLTLSRAKQLTIDGWQRPVKQPRKK